MENKTIGIIVKNDYDDILYYENNFFIKIDISKKDELRFKLEDKLSDILDNKAFRIDKISKKIPKLDLVDKENNEESMIMYIVKVYMYSDNSKFLPKEDILDMIDTSLYKEYYVKSITRYDKYYNLVGLYTGMFYYMLGTMIFFGFPFEISIVKLVFESFWITLAIWGLLPMFVIYKFIEPAIVNHLINYDLSEKSFKIGKWLYWISDIIFLCAMLNNIWRK